MSDNTEMKRFPTPTFEEMAQTDPRLHRTRYALFKVTEKGAFQFMIEEDSLYEINRAALELERGTTYVITESNEKPIYYGTRKR